VVDAILQDALSPEPVPEWMGGWLHEVASSGRMGADQREQISNLLRIHTAINEALDTTGDAEALMDRFTAEARQLLALGGLSR
jgi:hypothetical protein